MKRNRWRQRSKPSKACRDRRRDPSLLARINADVAGIDLHASEHVVAVPAERDPTRCAPSAASPKSCTGWRIG